MNYSTAPDLDIPTNDYDCWQRYPRHRWVYDLTRLMDAQNLAWSTVQTAEFTERKETLTDPSIPGSLGCIYLRSQKDTAVHFEVSVIKGDVKLVVPLDKNQESGKQEIKIAAFVALHFSKFTGVITFSMCQDTIIKISLKPQSELDHITNKEQLKIYKKIFKKQDDMLIGLTDRDFRETLAS